MPHQPSLFPPDEDGPSPARQAHSPSPEPLETRFESLRTIAATLPPGVRFGTSSWSFPGWEGLVYSRKRSASQLARDGLAEYARHPLFGTVGVDRSYYARIPDADFARYDAQLPDGFPCCCKAPAAVTSPTLPERHSAEPNPDFLSAQRFVDELIEPASRTFRRHLGPFLLQFPPMLRRSGLAVEAFLEGLDRFLDDLPKGFDYAVEVRDRTILCPAYDAILGRHGVGHVYNAWTRMPLPGEQADVVPVGPRPFIVVRLLLQPGATYEQQREAFEPFDRLIAPDANLREQVVDLVGQAVARAIPAYVLVNNKAEGSSPLTIEALAELLANATLETRAETRKARREV
jgi:uncharacterized protein YecE (DUF72 family)